MHVIFIVDNISFNNNIPSFAQSNSYGQSIPFNQGQAAYGNSSTNQMIHNINNINNTNIDINNLINIDGKSSVDELKNGLEFLKREIEDLKINNEKLTQYLNSINKSVDTSKKKNECNFFILFLLNFFIIY